MVLDGILWYFRTLIKKEWKNIELLWSYFAVYRQKIPQPLRFISENAWHLKRIAVYYKGSWEIQDSCFQSSLLTLGNGLVLWSCKWGVLWVGCDPPQLYKMGARSWGLNCWGWCRIEKQQFRYNLTNETNHVINKYRVIFSGALSFELFKLIN